MERQGDRRPRAGGLSILLSPGEFFTLDAPSTIWFRFNAAYAADALRWPPS
ncbi:hypothetical protein LP420_11195 [Massilia sp. B-10]|nr:hypothetical protein LP420_11195 [Massilia sp. B-10]